MNEIKHLCDYCGAYEVKQRVEVTKKLKKKSTTFIKI